MRNTLPDLLPRTKWPRRAPGAPGASLFAFDADSPGNSPGEEGRAGVRGEPKAAPAPALGLSSAQICRRKSDPYHKPGSPVSEAVHRAQAGEFILTVRKGGGSYRLREVGRVRPGRKGGGARGKIVTFTPRSRLTCLERLASIDRGAVRRTWFVTLTCTPDALTWENVERRRRAYLDRLRRKWGHLRWFAFWKKEAHKSGSPHLHLLIFWIDVPPGLVLFRAWNDLAWSQTVAPDDEALRQRVRRVGCRVEKMHSWNGVTWYAAKYLGETKNQHVHTEGRPWGIERRELFAANVKESELVLPAAAGRYFRRACRKLVGRRKERWYLREVGASVAPGESKWRRVSPIPLKVLARVLDRDESDLRGISPAVNVMLQVEHAKALNEKWDRRAAAGGHVSGWNVQLRYQFKRVRCNGCFNRRVPVWIEDEASSRVERGQDEFQAFTSSLVFADYSLAVRLKRVALANCTFRESDPLPWADDDLPF